MNHLSDEAEHLREIYGGHWGEGHPDHPIEDWRYEIANDDTRLGYWEWVAAGIEMVLAEEENEEGQE